MTEVTFIDAVQPLLNVLGGVAGITILYFFIVIYQNRKKAAVIMLIKEEQARGKERELRILRELRELRRELASIKRKVNG